MTRFQHLDGANGFPMLKTVSPFTQYESTFDYTRWEPGTRVKLCSVSFDCIDDFPKWGSADARSRYFAGLHGYEFEMQDSMRLVQDGIKLPIPFDASGLYNYVWVTLPRVTSQSQPLDNEPVSGVRSWGFFIRDLDFRSPSVTHLTLMVDWWSTFIDSVTINGAMLTRGHHAMHEAATVPTYLADPITHTDWLTGAEPDAPRADNCRHKQDIVINGSDEWAVFVTSASLDGTGWGSDADPHVNTGSRMTRMLSGVPTMSVFAVSASDVYAFVTSVPSTFAQTVQGLYLVPSDLLTLGDSFTFGGVTCRWVNDGAVRNVSVTLSQSDFGYPRDYAGITKLYTGQYARLSVMTDQGQTIDVAIDDLGSSPTLSLRSQVQAAGVTIAGVLSKVGSDSTHSIGFRNLANTRSINTGGDWLSVVLRWECPCYAVYQGAGQHYDATRKHAYDAALANAQRTYSASTNANQVAHDNAVRSATTARDNTKASAQTNTDNTARNATLTTTTAANSASNITANNAVTVAASTANNAANVSASTTCLNAATAKVALDVAADADASYSALTAEQAVVAVTATNNDARATTASTNNTINAATGLFSAALSMVGGGASGGAGGVVGGILGGIGGAVSTVGGYLQNSNSIATDLETANASCVVTASNNAALYQAGITNSSAKGAHANDYSTTATTAANSAKTTITTNNNDASTSIANNNASLINTNAASTASTMNACAAASQSTVDSNADNSYSTSVANADATLGAANNSAAQSLASSQASTNAARNDAYAQAPLRFGQYAGAGQHSTLPMVASIQIRRPSDGEIARVGDMMLRYGYTCNRYVRKPNLTEMSHFTYWQCADVWVSPSGDCPEVAANVIRDALRRGATVWSNPAEIGTVSIYDND